MTGKKRLFSKMQRWGFPRGSVVKNPPANAGDMVRSLVWEDPTMPQSNQAMDHNYCACAPGALLCIERSQYKKPESPTRQETPLAATRESLCAATKTHHSQKKKLNNKSLKYIYTLVCTCHFKIRLFC